MEFDQKALFSLVLESFKIIFDLSTTLKNLSYNRINYSQALIIHKSFYMITTV